jgi:hypothetical protein
MQPGNFQANCSQPSHGISFPSSPFHIHRTFPTTHSTPTWRTQRRLLQHFPWSHTENWSTCAKSPSPEHEAPDWVSWLEFLWSQSDPPNKHHDKKAYLKPKNRALPRTFEIIRPWSYHSKPNACLLSHWLCLNTDTTRNVFNKLKHHYDVHFQPDWFQICTSHFLQAIDDGHFAVYDTNGDNKLFYVASNFPPLYNYASQRTDKSASGLFLTGQQDSSGSLTSGNHTYPVASRVGMICHTWGVF